MCSMIFIFTALSLSSTISFSISSFNLAHIWMFLRISYLSVLMVLLVSANSLDLFHASFLPLAPRWGRQRVKGRGRQRQLVSPSHRPHDLRSHLYLCAALSFVGIQYASKRDNFFHCIGAFFFRLNFTEHISHPVCPGPWAFCFDLLWLSAKTSRSTNLMNFSVSDDRSSDLSVYCATSPPLCRLRTVKGRPRARQPWALAWAPLLLIS